MCVSIYCFVIGHMLHSQHKIRKPIQYYIVNVTYYIILDYNYKKLLTSYIKKVLDIIMIVF